MRGIKGSKPRAEMRRLGIRPKIILTICTAILIVVIVGISLGYAFGARLLISTIAANHVEMARILSVYISELIERAAERMTYRAKDSVHTEAVLESMLKYKDKDAGAINEYLLDMDKKWTGAEADSSLAREYLRGESAELLKRYVIADKAVAEVFITDKFGGLVAASGRTSDFYQADEKWWQEAYNDGKGAVYFGELEYDESVDVIAVTLALPMKDDKGEVIGVCKAVFNANLLFEPIRQLSVGKTGHASLVDNGGSIVYLEGIKPGTIRLCGITEFRDLISNPKKWGILASHPVYKKSMMTAFALLENPLLLDMGITFRVFFNQTIQEVFRPINVLFIQMGIVIGVLILILLPVAFILSGILIRPLKELHKATEHIARGDLDYPIKVKTGDELERLADSFREMSLKLKQKQNMLENWSKTLEKEVEKRTADLKKSQETTLHALEELRVSKEELEENLKELKVTQKMLVQTEKLSSLGRLVSEMAHEVSNPLMIISGRAQLGLMEDLKNKELIEDLRIIEVQCFRARDIIKRLLEFSKPTKGAVKLLDLRQLSEDVVNLVEHQFSLGNIKIYKNYCEEPVNVKVDPKQIEEVLFNIIKNAAEAMTEGGSITISTRREKERARIDVKDDGPGISEEVMQNIFDPFFTTKEDGTGLGLSVCFGIIKDHGGEIKYESKPGEGTTAIITLPPA